MSISILCNYAYRMRAIPSVHISNSLSYLGMLKNKPHYLNIDDEVYVEKCDGNLEYVAEWLPSYKMLWTDDPIIYRLITIKDKNYFYDMDFMDVYRYDETDKLVKYIGNYCPDTHTIY